MHCASFNVHPGALANTTGEYLGAPFVNDTALRRFSDSLMDLLSLGKIEQAGRLARENSHLDDPVVQQNLDEVFNELVNNALVGTAPVVRYVQNSKFGRSFIRHQYALVAEDSSMRCMITYRRKTDGWRLNQLWCNHHAMQSP